MWTDSKFLWLLLSAAVVGILEFLSLGGVRLPAWFEIPFFLAFILGIGYQTLWHGFLSLASFNFKNIQTLMLIAVAGAWQLGKYEEAAVVITLYTLAEKLEDIGMEKSRSALGSLFEKMPKTAFLKNLRRAVPIDEVRLGDALLIKPGEMIALDGKITAGISFVDESSITGESIPQEKFAGDSVYAGTLNLQGHLEIEVSKTKQNTTFARIQELTSQAANVKAPTQQFIERFSQYYTPSVIILAFLWTAIPVLFLGQSLDMQLANGLSILVIACPCALVISTPISIYSAIGNASKQGVLIKGGKYLESIGQIKAAAFDKTRTLTFGKPIVSDIIPFGNCSKAHLLECAAGIEIFSEHPLAESIVEAAKRENLSFHPVENFMSVTGKGAKADCLVCSDRHHCIGKLPFIMEEHEVPPSVISEIDALLSQGKTAVVIATHKEVEGVIALTDEVRPQSAPLILALKKMGIKPIMLTGDHESPARIAASQIGIEDVRSELLPEDKARIMQELTEKYRTVAMVGDGVNDAPALALSTVGISFGSLGSDAAIEAASIVILHDRLEAIPFLIRLGKKAIATIQFNVALAISVKLIFISLALFGMSNLGLAIFADVGITLIVILISLRLLNWKEVKY